ncbi:MAG: hypothetical protein JWP97_5998 [Labilithrix sp.]|nr:hypothetical protein [Labilithrix sp.]
MILPTMNDSEKPKPVDDLKQGLNLLFRAAKTAVESIPTDKIEGAIKDGAKEVSKAFEQVANEVDKVFHTTTKASQPPPPAPPSASPPADKPFDDAYAHEPPKGPRVG